MRVLILTSGSGKILNLILKGNSALKEKIFIYGDFKKSCAEIAKRKKIPILGHFKKTFSSKKLLTICIENKIDYIISYSFIHKIDGVILKTYSGCIFNSHHSIYLHLGVNISKMSQNLNFLQKNFRALCRFWCKYYRKYNSYC